MNNELPASNPVNQRLFSDEGMERETAEIEFYRPDELQAILNYAAKTSVPTNLLAGIALGGLAGLWVKEIVRLPWEDVWSIPGHIEVTAQTSGTHQYRLVEMVSSLAEWLVPYRGQNGQVGAEGAVYLQVLFFELLDCIKITPRRNGMRNGFCAYHLALHSNENLSAAQAGNSPAMIHANYKGLATKADAEKWFQVAPIKTPTA